MQLNSLYTTLYANASHRFVVIYMHVVFIVHVTRFSYCTFWQWSIRRMQII